MNDDDIFSIDEDNVVVTDDIFSIDEEHALVTPVGAGVFDMNPLTFTVNLASAPFDHSRCPQINEGCSQGESITLPTFLSALLLVPGQEQIMVHGDQSRLVDAKEETVIGQDSKTLINGMQWLTIMKDSVRNYIANQTVLSVGSKFSSHIGPLTEVHVAPRTMSEPSSFFTTVGSSFSMTGLSNSITGASFSTTGLSVGFTTGSVSNTGWSLSLTLLETKLDTLETGVIGFKLETTGLTTLLGALKAKICPVTASVGAKAGLLPDVRFPPIVFN